MPEQLNSNRSTVLKCILKTRICRFDTFSQDHMCISIEWINGDPRAGHSFKFDSRARKDRA